MRCKILSVSKCSPLPKIAAAWLICEVNVTMHHQVSSTLGASSYLIAHKPAFVEDDFVPKGKMTLGNDESIRRKNSVDLAFCS